MKLSTLRWWAWHVLARVLGLWVVVAFVWGALDLVGVSGAGSLAATVAGLFGALVGYAVVEVADAGKGARPPRRTAP